MFRNGLIVTYNENVQLATEKQLHDWLTSEDTLKIIGVIDEVIFYIKKALEYCTYNLCKKFMQVNLKMLNNIIEEEDDCFVFFYNEVDPDAHAILSELEGKNFDESYF